MAEMQELMIEMRLLVTSPKMTAVKLSEGIKRIITEKWPQCQVSIDDIQMVSVADVELLHREKELEEENGE